MGGQWSKDAVMWSWDEFRFEFILARQSHPTARNRRPQLAAQNSWEIPVRKGLIVKS